MDLEHINCGHIYPTPNKMGRDNGLLEQVILHVGWVLSLSPLGSRGCEKGKK